MRLAAFILALVGGIFGLIGAFLALVLTGTANALQNKSGDSLAGRSAVAMLCAVAIIAFGALIFANRRPRLFGVVLIAVSVLGLILAGFFFLGGAISLIGGLLALFVKSPAVPRMAGVRVDNVEDPIQELERMHALLTKGVISQAEYDYAKARLMG